MIVVRSAEGLALELNISIFLLEVVFLAQDSL